MEWIRKKLLKFLGVPEIAHRLSVVEDRIGALSQPGIDLDFKEQTQVYIVSKIDGGQIRHIPAHFDNRRDLDAFAQEIRQKFQKKPVIRKTPLWIGRI